MTRPSKTLILFDYSGVLSTEAPLFAGPDVLMHHIEAAGLEAFGIDSPNTFWNKIVNPTWQEGSTTASGYTKVLFDRILTLQQSVMDANGRAALAAACAAFVDRYLDCSRIDDRWKPVLQRIRAAPSVGTVIATDHYAEATDAIVGFLREWDIPAKSVPAIVEDILPPPFVVANSAQMGAHKTDPLFWRTLKAALRPGIVRRILLIDDFGHNEQGTDAYSRRNEVDERMTETVKTLEAVFSAPLDIFPFQIKPDITSREVRLDRLIAQAGAVVDRFLSGWSL